MTGKIVVRQMAASDEQALETLLTADPGNLVYASPPFLAFLRNATGAAVEVLLAERRGEPVGALPFAVLESPDVGRVVNSLPWWGSHGSVVLDRSAPWADDVREVLLARFAARIAELDPLSTTMVLLPDEEPHRAVYEASLRPTAVDGRIGQISALPPDGDDIEERLLASFAQKTRNLVRKSLKQGFVERIDDDESAWDFLHCIHRANIAALGGRAKPRAHFTALRAAFPPAMRRLSLAMDGTTPVAALLTLRFNGTVEYITPAIEVVHRPRQPLSFLIHRGMQAAVAAGCRCWNWGGTWHGQRDLHHFKAGFGAVDRPYSYLIRASDAGLRLFRERKSELATLFPFFYVYPFGALDDPA